jgi:alpha-methylacyl-CoA racemase
VIGIQSAVIERFSTNMGQHVDVSLTEAAMALAIPALAAQAAGAVMPRGGGALDGGLQNYNVYRTKDGRFLAVGALEDHFWAKFLTHIGQESLIPTKESAAGPLGGQPKSEEVTALFASKTYEDWLAIAAECDACIEPVLSVEEMRNHPQHTARNVFLPFESESAPGAAAVPPEVVLGPRMGAHPPTRLHRAARQGEHTEQVLKEAGFSSAEIAALKAEKAIR